MNLPSLETDKIIAAAEEAQQQLCDAQSAPTLDHAMVGNGSSCALIAKDGSVEWCCLPHFDSPSFFAALLDQEKGGLFKFEVKNIVSRTQRYLPKTNILETRITTADGSFDIIDFMPRYRIDDQEVHCPPELIRQVILKSGQPKFKVRYEPRPNYAKGEVHTKVTSELIKSFSAEEQYESLYLYSNANFRDVIEQHEIDLQNDLYFLVSYHQKLRDIDLSWIELEKQRTKVYWMNWLEHGYPFHTYADAIERSALTLKMLTFEKTGAILAAATTSLPETIGEQRNWDYRFCWIRDASMTVRTLMKIGHQGTAKDFLKFILNLIPEKGEQVQIMYGIDGSKTLEEMELPWLDGYANSKPVRIGNAAYTQRQNDIYGILLDAIEQSLVLFNKDKQHIEELWTTVRTLVRHVEQHWQEPDMGIWELRTQKKHFTFSKVLCWVAMDRAVKIAYQLQQKNLAQLWAITRDTIKRDILEHGWNSDIKAFTQAYGEPHLDASNLLMEEVGFIDASDPAFISTVYQSYEHLSHQGLAYRYINEDDFGRPHSSFTICSFWLIRSLHKIGEVDLAKGLFEQLLSYANPLGLFSEDIDFNSKVLLGNFPQAYSHLALIDTALVLSGQERSWKNVNDVGSDL